MLEKKDSSAIFLQVMAHDLLAPLTAIKWQTELLHKNVKHKKKREAYLTGIESSTELGISIAKNTHVASKVLSDTYEGFVDVGNMSEIVDKIANDLQLQFERHALALEKKIEINEKESEIDTPLVQLYVWAIAKYFLSITPPNNTVTIQAGTKEEGYSVTCSASHIPRIGHLISSFSTETSEGALDQKVVFIELIKKIAPKLNTNAEVSADGDNFLLKTTFS